MKVRVLRSDGDCLVQEFETPISYNDADALAKEAADYAVEAHKLGLTTQLETLVDDQWVLM